MTVLCILLLLLLKNDRSLLSPYCNFRFIENNASIFAKFFTVYKCLKSPYEAGDYDALQIEKFCATLSRAYALLKFLTDYRQYTALHYILAAMYGGRGGNWFDNIDEKVAVRSSLRLIPLPVLKSFVLT